MNGKKSRTLELLAFDEYCGFDTSAFFLRIKRGSLQTVKPARARPARAMYGEILRKFTETRARALRAHYALIFC